MEDQNCRIIYSRVDRVASDHYGFGICYMLNGVPYVPACITCPRACVSYVFPRVWVPTCLTCPSYMPFLRAFFYVHIFTLACLFSSISQLLRCAEEWLLRKCLNIDTRIFIEGNRVMQWECWQKLWRQYR